MNCPNCGAPLHLNPDRDFYQCDYCQGYTFPDKNEDGVRVFDETSDLACPLCSVPLFHAATSGWRLHYCKQCHGMLIRMAFFPDLIEELRAQLAAPTGIPRPTDRAELDRRISCPQCHAPMDAHFYGGGGNVILESCSACYLNWLDQSELRRIIHATSSQRPFDDDSAT